MYRANIAGLDQRLEALENAASSQPSGALGQLLADYSFDLYPYTKTKSTHRVKVSFSAVPHVWNPENTGYLCISGGDVLSEPIRTKCSWDGSRLTAQVDLDVADGYQLWSTPAAARSSKFWKIRGFAISPRNAGSLSGSCLAVIPIRTGHLP